MKKLIVLFLGISTALSAVSPTTSPTKKKMDGAVRIAREKVFKETEAQDIDRKKARKVARSIVRQVQNEQRQQ
jgi:hypothetical protein